MASRGKLTILIDAKTLRSLREIASNEGRELEALVCEALEDLVVARRNKKPRTNVMAAYHSSRQRFASLYAKLAD